MIPSGVMLGCWSLISDSNWGNQAEADSMEAIEASLESGIHSFDTAPLYGDGASEQLVGKALSSIRDRVFIATKVSAPLTASAVKQSCEASLRRLDTEYVDLYQIHWPDKSTPIEETSAVLLQLQAEGKIRSIGVCNFGPRDISTAAALMPLAYNQVPYSLLWRGIEFELLPLCRRLDIRILAYSPLMQGLLTGKFHSASEVPQGRARTKHFAASRNPMIRHGGDGYETLTFEAVNTIRLICAKFGISMSVAALACLLGREGVASVLPGARNSAQARQNAEVLQANLSKDAIGMLFAATDKLKAEIGGEIDLWADESRIQ